jgi:hypothetical protein
MLSSAQIAQMKEIEIQKDTKITARFWAIFDCNLA